MYNQFPIFEPWCHLNFFHYFITMLWWTNNLIAESLSTSMIPWIRYLKSFPINTFFQLLLTSFIKQSLSPSARSHLFLTITLVLQYWFNIALLGPLPFMTWPFLSRFHFRRALYKSEKQEEFSPATLFPVTAIFLPQNSTSLCSHQSLPLAD